MFIFNKTEIEGVFIIEPKVFGDERGYFMETYHEEEFKKAGAAFIAKTPADILKIVL